MTSKTFREIKEVFTTDSAIERFQCIANPTKDHDSTKALPLEHIQHAQRLLQGAQSDMVLVDLRSVISYLLCERCRTKKRTKEVEKKWKDEFPHLPFSKHCFDGRRKSSRSRSRDGDRRDSLSPTRSRTSSTSSHALPLGGHISPTYRPSRATSTGPQTAVLECGDEDDFDTSQPPLVTSEEREAGEDDEDSIISASVVPALQLDGVSIAAAGDRMESFTADAKDTPAGRRGRGARAASVCRVDQDPFYFGEAFTLAPWVIQEEVLSTLLEPLPTPKSKGYIYAFQVIGTEYVKIGYTTRKIQTRLAEIAKQHNQNLDVNVAFWLPSIPYLQLLRLEALVHADLAYFQRDLRRPNKKVHREYFKVDLTIAQQTIEMWYTILQRIRLEPNRSLDDTLCEEIRADPALSIKLYDQQRKRIPSGEWAAVNADHGRREQMWKTVFKLDEHSPSKSSDLSRFTKIGISIFCWMFLGTLNLPSQLFCLAWVLFCVLILVECSSRISL